MFSNKLDQLISLHQQVAGLIPALERYYPVAIVMKNQIQIYDMDNEQDCYQYIKSSPIPMPIPAGTRAAFQIEDYHGRIACVVTPEIFDSMDGYVTILHEFVHCYQYETCEQALKMQLDIANQAQERGDCMWEIQHPFPYKAINFIKPYENFLKALTYEDQGQISVQRKELQVYLGLHDYEYMVWQEWKEGYARWVENLVKRQLNMRENKGGFKTPYNRELFYAGGEAYINYLQKREPSLANDLRSLFHHLYIA